MTKNNTDGCSLCGTPEKDVKGKLIEGVSGRVCRRCVEKCTTIYKSQDVQPKVEAKAIKVPAPKEIKAFLDKYVIGQEHAKRVLSVAVHNHYKRIQQGDQLEKGHPLLNVEIDKSNVLLIGNTGTGKTLLAQTLAKMLNVPFTQSDATTLTEAGYVGMDLDSMLFSLYQNAGGDIARTEIGIIFLDEADKAGRKSGENASITRDVSGEGIQQGLLRMIESTIAQVPTHGGRKNPQSEMIHINTRNILFILGGSFVGLDKIIERRIKKRGVIGYTQGEQTKTKLNIETNILKRLEPDDLVQFGLIPELVGRLSVVCSLDELTKDDLIHILTQPCNAILKQYEKLIAMGGSTLKFETDAIIKIADTALARKTGARGLRSVVEEVMLPIMYELKPKQDIVITKTMVAKAYGEDDAAA